MLGIRLSRRSHVFARFTALCSAVLGAVVSLFLPGTALAGQVPPEPQASAEMIDETVTAVDIDASQGFFAEGGFLALIVEAGPVSWFVLATLLFFSLVSWAIILHKSRRLRRAEQESAAFLRHFRSATRFADVVARARKHPDSPLARLFGNIYREALRLWYRWQVASASRRRSP